METKVQPPSPRDRLSNTPSVTDTFFQFHLSRTGATVVDNIRVRFSSDAGIGDLDVRRVVVWGTEHDRTALLEELPPEVTKQIMTLLSPEERRIAATLLDRFPSFPVTRDQLQMLLEGNTCGDGAFALLGIEPTPFGPEQLGYLRGPKKENQSCLRNAA